MSSWGIMANRNRRLNLKLYTNPNVAKVLGSTPIYGYAKRKDTPYFVTWLLIYYKGGDSMDEQLTISEILNMTLTSLDISAAKFAEKLGITKTTMSRLINGKIKSVKPQVLVKLMDYIKPEFGITYTDLLLANGIDINLVDNIDNSLDSKMRVKIEEFKEIVLSAILTYLFVNNYSFINSIDTNLFYMNSDKYPELKIRTSMVNDKIWYLKTIYVGLTGSVHNNKIFENVLNELQSFILGSYLSEDIGKCSVVIDNENVFNYVVNTLKEKSDGTKIGHLASVSILVVDMYTRKIVNEYIVP